MQFNDLKQSIGKVTYDVLEQCYIQLQSRKWFNDTFPSIARTSSCNFTTIGGLFQHFNLAMYERHTYKRVCNK